jgi:DNA polymerase III subunit gamma/tau
MKKGNALFSLDQKANNAHLVLARKYRPCAFDDIIGQNLVVEILKNAIQAQQIPQAVLFTGIRGVGKTTFARLIAKALNCSATTQPTVSFCSECTQCQSIASSCNQDVLEIDAASHTGVDEIRNIIENAKYRPICARYKIYIIDEVHMLSNSAFNALLKILEEPPTHVKFVFATTEVKKIPLTVLSRCQRFNLSRISISDLKNHYSTI